MANTYTQLYVQIIFSVKGRISLIPKKHREELHRYITGIIANRDQKPLAIFAMPDHVHLLIGMKPDISISNLVRDIKSGSSKFINDNKWVVGRFSWQGGYGAFSYSKSQVDSVVRYILNQEEHHKGSTFKEEYLDFLEKFEIGFNEKYLFDWVEESYNTNP